MAKLILPLYQLILSNRHEPKSLNVLALTI